MQQWFDRFVAGDSVSSVDMFDLYEFLNPRSCKHSFVYWDCDPICCKCGVICSVSLVSEKKVMFEFWPRNYARTQYFQVLFRKINGLDLCPMSDVAREELIADMPKVCDWYCIYHKYKEWSLVDWWIAWCVMSYNKQKITMLPLHLKLMLYVDSNWVSDHRLKKKFNVFYMLFKIAQMTKVNTDWVPMKLRSTALKRLDLEWKQICGAFGWQFIETRTTLKRISWS